MYRDDLIRGEMARQRLSRKALALSTGLHVNTINAVCNGLANPEVKTLDIIAQTLHLNLQDLFEPRRNLRIAA